MENNKAEKVGHLHWQCVEVDDDDNEIGPADYDYTLICSECGAPTYCDSEEQAATTKKLYKYCYNCGCRLQ